MAPADPQRRRPPTDKDPTMRKGILIVADQALAAEAIRRQLHNPVPYTVVGCLDGRGSCSAAIGRIDPSVVIFDEMHDRDRVLRRIREARDAAPSAKLVLVSLSMDRRWLADASDAGIDAAIAKQSRPGSLGALLGAIVNGQVFHAFSPRPDRRTAHRAAGLTARENEILRFVAAGASNARIAGELWVTEQTVKFHLSNIFRKLGVANRTQASHYAHVHGIVGIEMPATTPASQVA